MRLAVITLLALLAFAVPPTAGAEVTREGILGATVSEGFERGESKTAYGLRSGGRTTPLLPTAPVTASTGDLVQATGTIHEGRLVGEVTQQQDLTPEADLVEPRKVAVVLIRFAGSSAQPWSTEQARREVFTGERSAAAYFREETWGKIELDGELDPEGDVFGPYTVAPTGGCSEKDWDAEARALAEAEGVSFSAYDHIIYMFPFQLSCSWLGRAAIGGRTASINGGLGGSQVVAHELGHNFYMRHAGSWSCAKGGVRVPVSTSCTTSEYGDPFDVMGNQGMRHNSAWNLRVFGLVGLPNGTVETVNSDGVYTLQSTLNASPEPHVLRISRADSPPGAPLWLYYLEIRQRGGIFEDFDDATMTGVSIRVVAENSAAETRLIDNNPGTASFLDAPLQVGRTFYDGHVHVTVLSAGGGSATVSVGYDEYEDDEPPSEPASLSATQLGDDVRLQWSASADNVGLSHYAVFRDGSEIGTSPGTSFTDASPTEGLHAYTVYAEDEAGNRSEASSPAVVTVGPEDEVGEEEGGGEEGGGGGSGGGDTPAPPDPPTVPAPAPPPGDGETEPSPVPRVKPILTWRRLRSGAYAVAVRVPRSADARRVGLWINGRRVRWQRGRAFRLRWRPRRSRCPRVYRLRARAYQRVPTGRIIATTRLARVPVLGRSGKCRSRARHRGR